MKIELLKWLSCPRCAGAIILKKEYTSFTKDINLSEINTGGLECISCNAAFPITNSIPRFVSTDNYTNNFGFQWNKFRKTQLDSHTHSNLSRDRFFKQSGWNPDELKGKIVLDAGCGAGRFTEIALSTNAVVVAIDYSKAVDACWENFKENTNLHVVQADIHSLPFKLNTFDYVYSFGVLQHIPDTKKAFFSLVNKVKKNGRICVDIYKKDWRVFFWPKYWLRPFTRNLSLKSLFKLVEKSVPILLPPSRFLGKIPKIGHYLKYAIPVANHKGVFSLNEQQLFEWAILDTFDMFSPKYDFPHTKKTILKWLKEVDISNIEVFDPGLVIARGIK